MAQALEAIKNQERKQRSQESKTEKIEGDIEQSGANKNEINELEKEIRVETEEGDEIIQELDEVIDIAEEAIKIYEELVGIVSSEEDRTTGGVDDLEEKISQIKSELNEANPDEDLLAETFVEMTDAVTWLEEESKEEYEMSQLAQSLVSVLDDLEHELVMEKRMN